MSIYDELLKLQKIPDAYTNWQEYRERLTDYIISTLEPESTLAVFGAGNCNDINLKRLQQHFSQIVLYDRDITTLYEALDTYHITLKENVILKETDFLGITPEEYREYADDVLRMIQVDGKNTDMDEVAEYAILRMKDLYQKAEKRPLSFGNKCYDAAVAVGVHSQINNMFAWLWQVYLDAVGKREDTVFEYVKKQNDIIIPRFDRAVFSCVKKHVIFGLEKERIGMSGGIQGAHQAFLDIKEMQKRGECLIEESLPLIWPFDVARNICYRMSILTIQAVTHL